MSGRPPADRQALARAFVAKAVLGLPRTNHLIDRSSPTRCCAASPSRGRPRLRRGVLPPAGRFLPAVRALRSRRCRARCDRPDARSRNLWTSGPCGECSALRSISSGTIQRPQKLLFLRFATSKVCNRYPTMAEILRPRLCPNSIAPSRLTNPSPTRWRRGWSSACAHGTRTNPRSVSGELETYETCYAACDFAATRRAWRLAVAVRGLQRPAKSPGGRNFTSAGGVGTGLPERGFARRSSRGTPESRNRYNSCGIDLGHESAADPSAPSRTRDRPACPWRDPCRSVRFKSARRCTP